MCRTSSSSTTATSSVGELAELVRQADVVLLPYDSREQVTSGVLIEAVAAGRPVVSTAFPHAIELLADGTGLVVPQRDPAALEAALRRVLSEPGLADDLAEQAGAEGARAALGRGGRPVPRDRGGGGRRPAWRRPRDRARARTAGRARRDPGPARSPTCAGSPTPAGCTSTRRASPRGAEHGYCLDDVARALVVVCREPAPPSWTTSASSTWRSCWRRRSPTAGSTTDASPT